MIHQDYGDAARVLAEAMKREVASTLEAAAELTGRLAELERLLQEQAYDRASLLGYQEISLAFVDLQRCLGGVQACHSDEHLLVEELARERSCSQDEARLLLSQLKASDQN